MKSSRPITIKFHDQLRLVIEEAANSGEGLAHWELANLHRIEALGDSSVGSEGEHLIQALHLGVPGAASRIAWLVERKGLLLPASESLESILRMGSDKGDPEAQRALGCFFARTGRLSEGQALLKESEGNGNPEAKIERLFVELFKRAPFSEYGGSRAYVKDQLGKGDPRVQRLYGLMCVHYYEDVFKYEGGTSQLRKARDLGCQEAEGDILEGTLETIRFSRKNESAASEVNPRKLATDKDYCLRKADNYDSAEPQSVKRRKFWLLMAFRAGSAKAGRLLCQLLDLSIAQEGTISKPHVLDLMKLAANAGDAEASAAIALTYYFGSKNVICNKQEARYWHQRAKSQSGNADDFLFFPGESEAVVIAPNKMAALIAFPSRMTSNRYL